MIVECHARAIIIRMMQYYNKLKVHVLPLTVYQTDRTDFIILTSDAENSDVINAFLVEQLLTHTLKRRTSVFGTSYLNAHHIFEQTRTLRMWCIWDMKYLN